MQSLGQQVALFRTVFPASAGKDWHDPFHEIFGRGITDTDELCVSIGQTGFESGITGWHLPAQATAADITEEYAAQFSDIPKAELTNYFAGLIITGKKAADDLWSRQLPPDYHLVLPALPTRLYSQTAINREAFTVEGSSLFLPMPAAVITAHDVKDWQGNRRPENAVQRRLYR